MAYFRVLISTYVSVYVGIPQPLFDHIRVSSRWKTQLCGDCTQSAWITELIETRPWREGGGRVYHLLTRGKNNLDGFMSGHGLVVLPWRPVTQDAPRAAALPATHFHMTDEGLDVVLPLFGLETSPHTLTAWHSSTTIRPYLFGFFHAPFEVSCELVEVNRAMYSSWNNTPRSLFKHHIPVILPV